MIAAKKIKPTFTCSSCGANHIKYAGRCHFCNSWGTIDETTVASKKDDKQDLDKWFEFQRDHELENGKCVCQNCKKPIRHQLRSKDMWVWRGSLAHVIAKSKFGSVAIHVHNVLILCLECHANYDHSWAKAVTMPVFAIAKTKFKLFRGNIKESITKIEKYFNN